MFLLIHFSACMAVHFLLAEDSPRRCVSERESPVGQPEKEREGTTEGRFSSFLFSTPLSRVGEGRQNQPERKRKEGCK